MIEESTNTTGTPSGVGVDGGTHGEAPTPAELLRLWKLHKAQCKHRVQKNCCVLSPMDEALWFTLPIISQHVLAPGTDAIVAQANPMRVGLLFSVGNNGNPVSLTYQENAPRLFTGNVDPASGNISGVLSATNASIDGNYFPTGCFVAPSRSGTVQGTLGSTLFGLYVNDAGPPMQILQRDSGPLCAMAWQGGSNGAVVARLTVIEIILKDWPAIED